MGQPRFVLWSVDAWRSWVWLLSFAEVVAVGGAQKESVKFFELLDFAQGSRGKRGFAFEGVEDDAFEKVAKGHVLLFGDGFEDFEEALLDADAGLDPLDFDRVEFGVRAWSL